MYNHYHFIGIGGIGMGTLAALVLAKGQTVSGSDVKENAMTKRLKDQGARIFIGHAGCNLDGSDVVVYSSAIRKDNPEMAAAESRQIPVLKRAELLSGLMENHVGITVAGAHGKTTTTSMISWLLINAGLNPTTAVGGVINGNGASYNADLGSGEYFVAEVDESDGSFLCFTPRYSIITNIDFEHLDYYQNWDNILAAYKKFIEQTETDGMIIACGDDVRLRKLLDNNKHNCITYGFADNNDVVAQPIAEPSAQNYRFNCIKEGLVLGTIDLPVPGRHNILNALACVCLGLQLSINFSVIQKSLNSYHGVNRRFQSKGQVGDICLIDDYAHHPTEIAATLQTAQTLGKKRVVAVFQPHRYSRTKFLLEEFVKSLSAADYLIVTDVYAASEQPIDGVSGQHLCELIKKAGKKDVVYLRKEEITNHLAEIVLSGDMIITLGAGDINSILDEFAGVLREGLRSVEVSKCQSG